MTDTLNLISRLKRVLKKRNIIRFIGILMRKKSKLLTRNVGEFPFSMTNFEFRRILFRFNHLRNGENFKLTICYKVDNVIGFELILNI